MGRSLLFIRKSFQNQSINASSGASILIIDHSQPATRSVGMGMYPSLMGTFSCLALILMIGSSFGGASSSLNFASFCTIHMEDPWILPSLIRSNGPVETDVSLPAVMIAYQVNLDYVAQLSATYMGS